MTLHEALTEAIEYAVAVDLPTTFGKTWRGQTWYVFAPATNAPDLAFIVISDDFSRRLVKVPVGKWFKDLRQVGNGSDLTVTNR